MTFNEKELRAILKWFDLSQDLLEEEDLKIYDKIIEHLDLDEDQEEEEEDFPFDFDDEDNFNYDEEKDD